MCHILIYLLNQEPQNEWWFHEAREMSQGLRAEAVLPEDLGSIPTPTWQLPTICNSSSRGSDSSSGLHRHHTGKILIHNNKSFLKMVVLPITMEFRISLSRALHHCAVMGLLGELEYTSRHLQGVPHTGQHPRPCGAHMTDSTYLLCWHSGG